MKILIAYYTRSGHTRTAAEKVRSCLGGLNVTLWEIPEEGCRRGARGWIRSCLEGIRKKSSSIAASPFRAGDFDLVVLGTPVWANSPASAVRAFCSSEAAAFRQVAFIGTHGGGGTSKTFAQLVELCGKEPVATLSLRDKDIREGREEDFNGACQSFAGKIIKSLKEAAPGAEA